MVIKQPLAQTGVEILFVKNLFFCCQGRATKGSSCNGLQKMIFHKKITSLYSYFLVFSEFYLKRIAGNSSLKLYFCLKLYRFRYEYKNKKQSLIGSFTKAFKTVYQATGL
jgi:hypothetical protein